MFMGDTGVDSFVTAQYRAIMGEGGQGEEERREKEGKKKRCER